MRNIEIKYMVEKGLPIKLKMICVLLDRDIIEVESSKYIFPLSHDSVIREIEKETNIIFTHDPWFFQFDTLLEGYDVTVFRDKREIVLSELLTTKTREKYGIDKEIRWEHNVYKILMAGGFNKCMRPVGNLLVYLLKQQGV